MNKFFAAILLSIILFSCDIRNTKNKTDAKGLEQVTQKFKDSTTVQVMDSVYNFGKVTDGEEVTYNFRFRNTGKNPLIITAATASCGCTVPEKPEEPVKPGETGVLKVVFHSKGRVGPATKTVTVTSNAYPEFPVMELKGEVVKAN